MATKRISAQNYRKMRRGAEISEKYHGKENMNEIAKVTEKYLNKKDSQNYKSIEWSPEANPQGLGFNRVRAHKLMEYGIKKRDLHTTLIGARLYESLGFENNPSVNRRLKKALENTPKTPKREYNKIVEETNDFLERNSSRNTIESKVLNSIFGISALAGIFFLSPNVTGNVIGNITKTGSNILGIVLIVFGLLGVFLKNKN